MADSLHSIDWDAVRRAAYDCLNAAWTLVCFAESFQGSEYDENRAAAHLEAIDRARDTFRPAMELLQPGFEMATADSIRYSPVFDALALATTGQSERPDFRYGPVCCPTAHEAAFELLRWAILWVENGLNAELDERGLPDQYVAGIDDLHKLSPEELRDTLMQLERRESLQGLLRGRGIRQIRAWIDQEWAAVSGGNGKHGLSAYAMSFDGAHWHISYDSERGFVNDSKGAAYIAQLLERRGKSIPCHVLHESTGRSLTNNDPTISKNDALTELALLREELAELRQRMEEKPHEVLPEDREEEQQILDRIRQLTGLGGRPRQKGAADAARTAVLKAVQRFYLACREKKFDAFVDHLELKLVKGSNPIYRGSFE